jgi:hypothetical protein
MPWPGYMLPSVGEGPWDIIPEAVIRQLPARGVKSEQGLSSLAGCMIPLNKERS